MILFIIKLYARNDIFKLILYILHALRLSIKYKYPHSRIITIVETSVSNDMLFNTTIHKYGAKSVCLKSTRHEKFAVIVCLAAKVDGTKLRQFFVFRAAKRESKSFDEESESCCVVKSSANVWVKEEVINIWVKQVLGVFSFNKQLLVWDSYECHMTDSVRKDIKTMNVDSVIIPGGCSKYIQAFDLCWNKPFRVRMTKFYDQWLSAGVHRFTEGGNVEPPSRKTII